MTLKDNYGEHIKKQYLMQEINSCFVRKRKCKYSNTYLLDMILDFNLNYTSWGKFGRVINTDNTMPKFHNKYLNEIYLKWSKLGIFKNAYNNLIKDTLEYDKKNLKLNTDVTCISNMYGKKLIGINPEYTKKKCH